LIRKCVREERKIAFSQVAPLVHTGVTMRVGLLLGLLLAALTVGACSSAPPETPVDVMNDPSWIPPGQGDLAIGADPEPKKVKPKRARHLEQPNKANVPTSRPIQAMNP
jgi:hypothetical protein